MTAPKSNPLRQHRLLPLRGMGRTIGWRIFLTFTVLLLTLVSVLGVGGFRFAKDMIAYNAANELRVLSVTLANQVQRYLSHMESSLKSTRDYEPLLAELRKEHRKRDSIDSILKQRLMFLPAFEELAIFDLSGSCIAATDPDWYKLSVRDTEFFKTGLRQYHFGDVLNTLDEGKLQIVSEPLRDGGHTRGVLVAQVALREIYSLMDQRLGIPGSSDIFLLDSRLRFITAGRTGSDELVESHLTSTPIIGHMNEPFWVGRYENYEGDEVLGTVARIPGYPWSIVIERDVEEIELRLNKLFNGFLGGISLLVIGLLATTYFIARSITKPIASLVQSAQRIASGDLVQPVEATGGPNEIVFLANEFEQMRSRIAASQGRLREQLEDSEQRRIESERLAAIGTLAASMAHEIRNPLNAISLLIARIENARTGFDPTASLRDVRHEISRLDRLVSAILDYARPVKLNMSDVNLADLVMSVKSLYEETFTARHITCRCDLPSEAVLMRGDADRLRQCLVNLLQNAIEAIPMDSDGLIAITLLVNDDSTRIIITDNGVGLPNESIGRMFDLFFTTKESGTGLGLSTVRKIIDAHGGQVTLDNSDNRGTIVTIAFPRSSSEYSQNRES